MPLQQIPGKEIKDRGITSDDIDDLAIESRHIKPKSILPEQLDLQTMSGFSVYKATTIQAINTNTWTKVTFNTEIYDMLNEFNLSQSRFVALSDGTYTFSLSIEWSSDAPANRVRASLYVNGSSKAQVFDQTASSKITVTTHASSGTATIKLKAGDYVEVYCYTSDGTDVTYGPDLTYFNGIKTS